MVLTSDDVKATARKIGFDLVGITTADPFPKHAKAVKDRTARGSMPDELVRHFEAIGNADAISDPRTAMPEARSIIVLGMRYLLAEKHTGGTPADPTGRISKEYWRRNYPELRRMRAEMIADLREKGAKVSDSVIAPTKAAAHRSGIGRYGKNSIIQNEDHGSWVVYTTITTDLVLPPDEEEGQRCGACQKCMRLCPAKAIAEPFVIDAGRCLTYVLASPDPIPLDLREAVGDRVNSCEMCQEVCPRNENVSPVNTRLEEPFGRWTKSPKLLELVDISQEEFDAHFADLEWFAEDVRLLRRNAIVALGNVGDVTVIQRLETIIGGNDAMLAEHAAWAKGNILRRNAEEGRNGVGTAI